MFNIDQLLYVVLFMGYVMISFKFLNYLFDVYTSIFERILSTIISFMWPVVVFVSICRYCYFYVKRYI